MSNDATKCWFCGRPSIEVWKCRRNSHDWPMCAKCSTFVRAALALRRHGEIELANALDTVYGIETRNTPGFEEWIDPKTSVLSVPSVAPKG